MGAAVCQRVELASDLDYPDAVVADLDKRMLPRCGQVIRGDSHLARLVAAHAATGAESRNSLAAFSNATALRTCSGRNLSVWAGSSKSQWG